ncbi:beta strand repeat-containing protein [Candidatus Spongiihabitans sp.]|uniref:beta strand repeat-containing protein n=1 Tax=Candidatus Spongiihabitans sp. TaxID=3101308 RepID=UPI003C6EE1BD
MTTPAVLAEAAVDAVPGVYDITLGEGTDAPTYVGVTGMLTIGTESVLTLATEDTTDSDGDGNTMTVTYNGSQTIAIKEVTAPIAGKAAVDAVDAVTTEVGGVSTAIGDGSITKGVGSIAIGEGATVGRVIPAVEAKAAVDAVPGVYDITLGEGNDAPTYNGVTGNIIVGQESILMLATEDTTDSDGDGNTMTVTYNGSQTIAIKEVTAPVAGEAEVVAMDERRGAVENALAIGAAASATGNNGVALGSGATAAENGIAIGGRRDLNGDGDTDDEGETVIAGENEIVIGRAGQTAVIGGVDLAGIATNTVGIATNTAGITANTAGITANTAGITANTVGIATNTAGIATNTAGIATNTAGIATNTAGIATNTAGIATNTAGIATNKNAIDTNRSGIAMSVALAHLPTIKGGGWGIAAGTFDSETAIAVGAHFSVQQNAFIKVGAASSGGETSFGIGYGKGF